MLKKEGRDDTSDQAMAGSFVLRVREYLPLTSDPAFPLYFNLKNSLKYLYDSNFQFYYNLVLLKNFFLGFSNQFRFEF